METAMITQIYRDFGQWELVPVTETLYNGY